MRQNGYAHHMSCKLQDFQISTTQAGHHSETARGIFVIHHEPTAGAVTQSLCNAQAAAMAIKGQQVASEKSVQEYEQTCADALAAADKQIKALEAKAKKMPAIARVLRAFT